MTNDTINCTCQSVLENKRDIPVCLLWWPPTPLLKIVVGVVTEWFVWFECWLWMFMVHDEEVLPCLWISCWTEEALSVHCCRSCRQNSARPGQFSECKSCTSYTWVAHEEPAELSSGHKCSATAILSALVSRYSATSHELSFSPLVTAHSSPFFSFHGRKGADQLCRTGSASSWRECVSNSSPCARPTVTCISAV